MSLTVWLNESLTLWIFEIVCLTVWLSALLTVWVYVCRIANVWYWGCLTLWLCDCVVEREIDIVCLAMWLYHLLFWHCVSDSLTKCVSDFVSLLDYECVSIQMFDFDFAWHCDCATVWAKVSVTLWQMCVWLSLKVWLCGLWLCDSVKSCFWMCDWLILML